ncbi:signal peptidase I [Alteromonas sp. 5E99-2]|uniref:signal peptidase I n=1 Tax=Alteromonas sp. 5E99-2 TaxID=2817683 RepID=UPI001A9A1AF6|nr:signal peptidase I [Alteromonas sp. 5E99-2]MBO1254414.1 signal peptidase I [Alteromonas sp. 5E99-2]
MRWLKKTVKENKGFILFIVLMVVFRSAIADWNDVPTGSMKPTIVEGDRILVDKLAYDIRLPFSKVSLKKLADPVVGDIIIFDSQAADKRLVKRVVGVPGDTVAMVNNQLIINGKALDYQMVSSSFENQEKIEILGGITHKIYTHSLGSQLSNFPMVTIPQGQYLALGDNRDNSADSRVIGFVPRNEIIGRSKKVVVSFNYDNYFLPRAERFMHTL